MTDSYLRVRGKNEELLNFFIMISLLLGLIANTGNRFKRHNSCTPLKKIPLWQAQIRLRYDR